MRKPIYIPEVVINSISEHVDKAVTSAVDGYFSANEDEDTMTGHLGALLRIGPQRVRITQGEANGEWTWMIDYYKFRGRGARATEKILGADGILELSLDRPGGRDSKSVLFQSKLDWSRDDSLLGQCVKMSTWREAACVFNYTQNGFEAFRIDQVLRSRGRRNQVNDVYPLEKFLSTQFVRCEIGDADLSYDGQTRRLIWRAHSGEVVSTRFQVKHRLRFKVKAPATPRSNAAMVEKEISGQEVHKYRMDASERDILRLGYSPTQKEIKAAQKQITLSYHPDQFSMLDDLERAILNRRMQEFNDLLDKAAAKAKGRE